MDATIWTPRHLVVSAFPSPTGFGHSLVSAYSDVVQQAGQAVAVRDLYALDFDPVLRSQERPACGEWAASADVDVELAELGRSDILVLAYPIWFGLPPAMLKGYVDRVLGANYSYKKLGDRSGQAVVKGKPLLSFSTSAMPLSWLDEQGQVTALRQLLDVYLWRGFGMARSEHVMLDGIVPNISRTHADACLDRVRQTATRTCARLAGVPIELGGVEA